MIYRIRKYARRVHLIYHRNMMVDESQCRTRIFFREQDTTSLVTVLLVFECLLFIGYISERKDITYGKHKLILDISAIEQATCHNIHHLFDFIHTLFSFHFFFFLLSLYLCIPSLIALHKQTMNFICICALHCIQMDLIIYPLALLYR